MLKGGEATELTRQNIQARIRGQRMWNWANSSGALFLQTGDMSEKAVGYTTIGGDLEGCAVGDRQRARKRWSSRCSSACTAASASRASPQRWPRRQARSSPTRQAAEEELMPFPVLDACLHLYAGEKMSPDESGTGAAAASSPTQRRTQANAWAARFATLFTQSIYKWVQSPLSLHVGSLDLDRERALQMPVVQKTEWTDEKTSQIPQIERNADFADFTDLAKPDFEISQISLESI